MALCTGSGGWSNPTPEEARKTGLPLVQLYDLAHDVGEKTNLADNHPEVVDTLIEALKQDVENGDSTSGKKQKNDGKTKFLPDGYECAFRKTEGVYKTIGDDRLKLHVFRPPHRPWMPARTQCAGVQISR